MSTLKKRVLSLVIAIIIIATTSIPAFAAVWAFGATGSGNNPFNPRGYYLITKDGTSHWLSSKFITPSDGYEKTEELGRAVKYTGVVSGLDYVKAEDVDRLFVATDRNPTPGHKYLVGYSKNGKSKPFKKINGFSDMIKTPGRNNPANADPNGGQGWCIPIELDFTPGTYYEFAFLRGMQANNGTTCVIDEENRGYLKVPFTAEEQKRFNLYKNEEYQYISDYTKNEDGTYELSFVPMRYSVQTYADMSEWENAAANAQAFLDSITPSDYTSGKYIKSKVENLRAVLSQLTAEAEVVKKTLQAEADKSQEAMAAKLNSALLKAKSNEADSDFTAYNKALSEAKALYAKVKNNTGTSIGNYGANEVRNLADVISHAESTVLPTSLQSVVDAETSSLNSAVALVKKSLVTEEQLVFYDKATGIYVTVSKGALPSGTTLYVGEIEGSSIIYSGIRKSLKSEPKGMTAYEIKFFKGDEVIKPNGRVKIQIPVLSTMNAENTSVGYVTGSGEKTSAKIVASSIANETQMFTTDSMGTFVVIEFKNANDKAENGFSETTKLLVNTNELQNEKHENEMREEEQKVQENKKPELVDKEKENEESKGFELDSIKRQTDEEDIILVAGGSAGLGVLMGAAAFIKFKREKEFNF